MTREVRPLTGARFGADWWRRGVVYQIYPRSFADSDGDGVGDLGGIIDHLDHLGPTGLGVDAIWLSPIYRSPGHDLGYDVCDHSSIDPLFGLESDFDRLVDEAHARGIRVILDLVMNHTSDAHPWFASSRTGRDSPHADWYLWRDPSGVDSQGEPLPPNNWLSWFGGSGWTYVGDRGQSYFHTFLAEQPDLDWRTPAVEAAQFEMVRGWLDRGVDGFRLDVFNAFLKHPDLLSNPVQPGTSPWSRQRHVNDRDQPDLGALMARFRAILDERPGRMSVGELFDGGIEAAAALTSDRHLVFDWELIAMPWTADGIHAALARREAAFGADRWPTVVLSNHDQPRHASRFAASAGADDRDAIARAAAVLLLTTRGTPFMYYGEELGMGDVEIPPDERVDLAAGRASGAEWWDRSPCRTPMPWTSGPGAGFSTGRPWLRLDDDTDRRNVRAQEADPDSVLACYRRLLAARASMPGLQSGGLSILEAGDPAIVAYRRGDGPSSAVVALNLGAQPTELDVARLASGTLRPVVGSQRGLPGPVSAPGRLELRAREALILVPDGPGSS